MEMWPATINGYLAHARLAQAARVTSTALFTVVCGLAAD